MIWQYDFGPVNHREIIYGTSIGRPKYREYSVLEGDRDPVPADYCSS